MSLKWLFVITILIYGFSSFSSEIQFNRLINESNQAQLQLASEIQDQTGVIKQKTLKNLTASETVAFEGFNIKIFN